MSTAKRYQKAHKKLLSKASEELKKKVDVVKGNPDHVDAEVSAFVRSVIDLAESDEKL